MLKVLGSTGRLPDASKCQQQVQTSTTLCRCSASCCAVLPGGLICRPKPIHVKTRAGTPQEGAEVALQPYWRVPYVQDEMGRNMPLLPCARRPTVQVLLQPLRGQE